MHNFNIEQVMLNLIPLVIPFLEMMLTGAPDIRVNKGHASQPNQSGALFLSQSEFRS